MKKKRVKLGQEKEVEGTAYHEAGHAVAAFNMKIKFKLVSIEPGKDDLSLGRIILQKLGPNFHPDYDLDTRTKIKIHKRIIIDFAGHIAEAKFNGDESNYYGAEGDFHNALELALYLGGAGPKEAKAYLNWMYIKTENMISLTHNWKAVEAVAKELLRVKTIGYMNVRNIIRDAING